MAQRQGRGEERQVDPVPGLSAEREIIAVIAAEAQAAIGISEGDIGFLLHPGKHEGREAREERFKPSAFHRRAYAE